MPCLILDILVMFCRIMLDAEVLYTFSYVSSCVRACVVKDECVPRAIELVHMVFRHPYMSHQHVQAKVSIISWSICITSGLLAHATSGRVVLESLSASPYLARLPPFFDPNPRVVLGSHLGCPFLL